jgi:hypothetical protein
MWNCSGLQLLQPGSSITAKNRITRKVLHALLPACASWLVHRTSIRIHSHTLIRQCSACELLCHPYADPAAIVQRTVAAKLFYLAANLFHLAAVELVQDAVECMMISMQAFY